jgi:hypothetical protein
MSIPPRKLLELRIGFLHLCHDGKGYKVKKPHMLALETVKYRPI